MTDTRCHAREVSGIRCYYKAGHRGLHYAQTEESVHQWSGVRQASIDGTYATTSIGTGPISDRLDAELAELRDECADLRRQTSEWMDRALAAERERDRCLSSATAARIGQLAAERDELRRGLACAGAATLTAEADREKWRAVSVELARQLRENVEREVKRLRRPAGLLNPAVGSERLGVFDGAAPSPPPIPTCDRCGWAASDCCCKPEYPEQYPEPPQPMSTVPGGRDFACSKCMREVGDCTCTNTPSLAVCTACRRDDCTGDICCEHRPGAVASAPGVRASRVIPCQSQYDPDDQ